MKAMTKEAYKIGYEGHKHNNATAQQSIAIELALGISLPHKIEEWPIGLVGQWNDAVDANAFEGCISLGTLAEAFLTYRQAKLKELRK
ncbi:MAG: hypothetical protein IE937_09725 [Gammaproteobacteria bacterium]|nr:hypothetical protein [Gammaproteobacteria bacterium]